MKKLWGVGLVWIAMVAVGVAAESRKNSDRRSAQPPVSKFCDPICELRSQDAAFSLLMEVFRQHQSYRIETDYQIRLQGIGEIEQDQSGFFIETNMKGLKQLRQFMFGLARRERELRMVKLETQVANLQAAYGCVRKIDEDYVGEKVPKNLDQNAAQDKLKELVILAPGTLAKGDAMHARSISAGLVLLNSPPGPVNNEDLVEPCD